MNENVFQCRLAHADSLNLTGKCLDYLSDKTVAVFHLEAHPIRHHSGIDPEASANALSERFGIAGGIQHDDVSADFMFQLCRRTQSD